MRGNPIMAKRILIAALAIVAALAVAALVAWVAATPSAHPANSHPCGMVRVGKVLVPTYCTDSTRDR